MSHRVTRSVMAATTVMALTGTALGVAVAAPQDAAPTASATAPLTDTTNLRPGTGNTRFIVTLRGHNGWQISTPTMTTNKAKEATEAAGRAHGRRVSIAHFQGTSYVVTLHGGANPAEAEAFMAELAKAPDVTSVRADLWVRNSLPRGRRVNLAHPRNHKPETDRPAPHGTFNDEGYAKQWNLHDPQGGMRVPQARQLATGKGVVVAVIDTGYVDHPDLDAHRLPGYDFISMEANSSTGKAIDYGRDGDSYDADPHDVGDWHIKGQGPCTDPTNPRETNSDSSFHGSHVAGIIAAVSGNGQGIAGVSEASFMPVRALGECGGWTTDIANAIRWSAGATDVHDPFNDKLVPPTQHKADIINLSLGGDGVCSTADKAKEYRQALNFAHQQGVAVVVAAGNENQDTAGKTPAGCAHVITVGATGPGADSTLYSNFGEAVDVSAPGGDMNGFGQAIPPVPGWGKERADGSILSTVNTSRRAAKQGKPGYTVMDGTSMAAPHVAGVIALMKSANPALTPEQAEQLLRSTARGWSRFDSSLEGRPDVTSIPAQKADACTKPGKGCGTGLVDAYAAVAAAKALVTEKPAPMVTSSPAPMPKPTASASPVPATSPSPDLTAAPSVTPSPAHSATPHPTTQAPHTTPTAAVTTAPVTTASAITSPANPTSPTVSATDLVLPTTAATTAATKAPVHRTTTPQPDWQPAPPNQPVLVPARTQKLGQTGGPTAVLAVVALLAALAGGYALLRGRRHR